MGKRAENYLNKIMPEYIFVFVQGWRSVDNEFAQNNTWSFGVKLCQTNRVLQNVLRKYNQEGLPQNKIKIVGKYRSYIWGSKPDYRSKKLFCWYVISPAVELDNSELAAKFKKLLEIE